MGSCTASFSPNLSETCAVANLAQRPMGLGILGNPLVVFKRKFRWTMAIEFCNGTKIIPEHFVKIASRPQMDFEETEINFLHGKFWLPGKQTWQDMTVTYYDVAGSVAAGAGGLRIFDWIATVYDITDPTCLQMGQRSDYEGVGHLFLYDGCGDTIELWNIKGMWPKGVNFGELDMSSSEEMTIELTIKFREVTYLTCCPEGNVSPCACTPCS